MNTLSMTTPTFDYRRVSHGFRTANDRDNACHRYRALFCQDMPLRLLSALEHADYFMAPKSLYSAASHVSFCALMFDDFIE